LHQSKDGVDVAMITIKPPSLEQVVNIIGINQTIVEK
jgi:hypothetical protein